MIKALFPIGTTLVQGNALEGTVNVLAAAAPSPFSTDAAFDLVAHSDDDSFLGKVSRMTAQSV